MIETRMINREITNAKSAILDLVFSFLISIVFCLAYAQSISPFSINCQDDSVIFQQMGLAILQGKIPYVDIFDHKGIVFFWIQALGQWLHPYHVGIFSLFVINIALSIYFWIKIARLKLNGILAFIPAIFTLFVYRLTICCGNYTECWSLPFISYSLYVLARSFCTEQFISKIECLNIGVCIGLLSFFRINNIAPILVVCLAYAYYYIRNKKFTLLWKSLGLVSLGIFITVLAVTLLFGILYGFNHIYDLYYGTFIFNLKYYSVYGSGGDNSIVNVPFIISLIVLFCLAISNHGFKSKEFLFCLICFLVTYLSFGKAFLRHYYTITVPIYALAFVAILSSDLLTKFPRWILYFCCLLVMSFAFLFSGPSLFPDAKSEEELKRLKYYTDTFDKNASIWNYNAGFTALNVLQNSGLVQCNKILLPFHVDISDALSEICNIEEYSPDYIIANEGTFDKDESKIVSFVLENYELTFSSNNKINNKNRIVIYKKK